MVGRTEELDRLHNHLRRHGQAAVVPVAGTGGIGKTALAMGYVATFGEHYELIAWIEAERPELIARQYRSLVRNATTHDVTEADALAAARALLAGKGPALVVFDNATTAADLHPYLPSGDVTVLVTTRNETWSLRRDLTFELEHLPPEVVVAWLSRELVSSQPEYIAALAQRLGGLPLAIIQALAYLGARPGTTAGDYVGLLATKDGQRKAYGTDPPPGYPRPVAATSDLAVEALATEAPPAVELLRHLAFVAPDRVPIALLAGLIPDVPDALAALRRYGLVRSTDTHLRLHRLVQDITRWSLDPDEEAAIVKRWAGHLEASIPDPEDHRNFGWFAEAASHVLALMDHAATLSVDATALARVAGSAGTSLLLQASFRLAQELLDQALVIKEAAYGPDHPQVAITLTKMGVVRQELGNHAGAVEASQRALAILEASYGLAHASVAGPLTNLGNVRTELGDYAGAVKAYERALAIKEAAYGPDHPQVAITLIGLGNSRRELDDHTGAIEVLERALVILEAEGRTDHPQVAMALTNLGIVRTELGDHAAAAAALDRALAIKEAAYGPDHPQVAITLANLGIVRRDLGDYIGAVKAYERDLAISLAAYGPRHPQVAITLNNLGEVRHQLGDHSGAVEALERAVAIFEAAYGPNHPLTEKTRASLDVVRGHAQG